jgi:hypothetical protein
VFGGAIILAVFLMLLMSFPSKPVGGGGGNAGDVECDYVSNYSIDTSRNMSDYDRYYLDMCTAIYNARTKKDPLYCLHVNMSGKRTNCLLAYSIWSKDADGCGLMESEYYRNYCFVLYAGIWNQSGVCEYVRGVERDYCFASIAVRQSNAGLCERVSDDDMRFLCGAVVSKNSAGCSGLAESRRSICEQSVLNGSLKVVYNTSGVGW